MRLDVTVREQATGYEEQHSQLFTVAASAGQRAAHSRERVFKPGLPLALLVLAETPGQASRSTPT